jgi:CRP-like cAMP-binding protein
MSIEDSYLFGDINKQTLQRIKEIAVEESYPQAAFLFHAGDAAEYFYVLTEGRVRLCIGEQGHVAYVISDPGDAIGWSSMVGREKYTATAECIAPVKLRKIKRDTLIQLFESDAASGLMFFRRLAGLIGQRLLNCYKAAVSVHGERDPHSYG